MSIPLLFYGQEVHFHGQDCATVTIDGIVYRCTYDAINETYEIEGVYANHVDGGMKMYRLKHVVTLSMEDLVEKFADSMHLGQLVVTALTEGVMILRPGVHGAVCVYKANGVNVALERHEEEPEPKPDPSLLEEIPDWGAWA